MEIAGQAVSCLSKIILLKKAKEGSVCLDKHSGKVGEQFVVILKAWIPLVVIFVPARLPTNCPIVPMICCEILTTD